MISKGCVFTALLSMVRKLYTKEKKDSAGLYSKLTLHKLLQRSIRLRTIVLNLLGQVGVGELSLKQNQAKQPHGHSKPTAQQSEVYMLVTYDLSIHVFNNNNKGKDQQHKRAHLRKME